MNVAQSLQNITDSENLNVNLDKGIKEYNFQKKVCEMEEEESDETYNLRNKNNKKERIVIKNPFTPQFKKLNMKLGNLHLYKTKGHNLDYIEHALLDRISQENENLNHKVEGIKNGFIKELREQIKKSKINIDI
jgi:hypothetical protein